MGWYYTDGASRADCIREQLQLAEPLKVLKWCTRGNVLWVVIKAKQETFIYCGLMQRDRDGWGYKPMDESMGPNYYSCPLSYLELCTSPVNAWARDWRIQVRKYHQARKAA